MHQIDYSAMLEVAIVAARLAGQKALEEQAYAGASVKNASELVTNADPLCQKIIIDRIMESYPSHGFIGEEGDDNKLLKYTPRQSDAIWWVIDPIDGTNNFAKNMYNYAVSIAAFHEGQPIIAVIFDPATDTIFTAAKGSPPLRNGSSITQSSDKFDKYSSIAIDAHMTQDMEKPILEIMHRTRFRNAGSTALHLAYVAAGSMIAAIGTRPKLWDYAAGALLVQSANAKLTDLKGSPIFPIDLESYEGQTSSILAANTTCYDEIFELFNK